MALKGIHGPAIEMYEWFANMDGPAWQAVGRMMLDLMPRLEAHLKEVDVWSLTSHHILFLLPENNFRCLHGVSIRPSNEGYFIGIRRPEPERYSFEPHDEEEASAVDEVLLLVTKKMKATGLWSL